MTAENYVPVTATIMANLSSPESPIDRITTTVTAAPEGGTVFGHPGEPVGSSSAGEPRETHQPVAPPPQASTTSTMLAVARTFLERVVPWPADAQAPGCINLHYHVRNGDPNKNGGKPFMDGRAFKTVDEALTWLAAASRSGRFFDFYFCTSLQCETAGLNKNGQSRAKRNTTNATHLKAIWLDIDVKADDPQHYGTLKEAWGALGEFRKKAGLPFPSAIVNSGGGLHIYWISHIPLTVEEWHPYANGLKALAIREGLKADHGVTADAARLLRVPGTLNYKYDPPRRVELLQCR